MPNKFRMMQPTPLLVGLLVICLGFLITGREMSDQKDSLPVFLSENEKNIYVELTFSDFVGGVYQINDGLNLIDVIKLTELGSGMNITPKDIPLVSGQRYFLRKKARGIELLEVKWMDAGKRMALSIPLHPDRMSYDDWQALPGIGEKLAEKIETDRQNNGDFGSLESLARVKGIGQKSLEKWRKFFVGA